jgi:hypothetical protein
MRTIAALLVSLSVLAAVPALAQQVEIEAPVPGRERPEIRPPALHYEQTRPSDREYYPDGPKVEADPAFIEPFASGYDTGETSGFGGVAGWTASNPPLGPAVASGHHEVNGWFALGFAVTWGGPTRLRPAAR